MPEPRPEEEQPTRGARASEEGQPSAGVPDPGAGQPGQERWGGPGWAWAEGSADGGPVPECYRPGPQPEPPTADGLPAGLDYAALVEALGVSGALGSDADDQDAEFAELLAAEEEGRLEPADPAAVAAMAVEFMGPGAAQAGWLEVAAAGLGRLDEYALAGVAIAARQAASRAQAAELAAVAQITARAAQADPRIGLSADGRPARVCRDALGQIEQALRLNHYSAEAWADLAVTLTWRLRATGAALAGGRIDLDRADLIAGMTSVLTEEQARSVEEKILPVAGRLARADLRERLAHAVLAADPDGAERRREQAERNADVRLYADDDQTATITGSKLPQVLAAAGFARLTALARARKAAGIPGGLGFHRAQVMLGMLLDTLPYIPPADGAPPDQPPPGDDGGPGPAGGPGDARGPADSNAPGPADGTGPRPAGGDGPRNASAGGTAGIGDPDGSHADDDARDDDAHDVEGMDDNGGSDDLPGARDEDAPPDDGLDDHAGSDSGPGWDPAEDDDLDRTGPAPAWPALGVIAPGLARRPAGPPDGRPVPGLLDAVVPWTTLAGLSQTPGRLGRIGPITAGQARLLARAAEHDPGAQWRVIVTNEAGQAIAVARIRRPRYRPGPARDGPAACRDGPPPPGAGLVGRITVTITQDTIAAFRQHRGTPRGRGSPGSPGPPGSPGSPGGHGLSARAGPYAGGGPGWRGPPPVVDAALRVGARALDRAAEQAAADAAAGGCAHADQSPAYRPAPRLREYITARDVTCRSPVCRQPAWRADLDHTRPYDQHGKTCRCNLGGGCRRDHQLKQHPRWKLEQNRPGYFTWTAPGGRTCTVGPDIYPV